MRNQIPHSWVRRVGLSGVCLLASSACHLWAQNTFGGASFAGMDSSHARINVPTTKATLQPPPGWTSGPRQNGAVIGLQAPDGLAQIMVNVVQPRNGMTPDALRDAMEVATRTEVENAGMAVERHESVVEQKSGLEFHFLDYPINDPNQSMLLQFCYVVAGEQVFAFNTSALLQSPQRIAEARACVLSLSTRAPVVDPPTPVLSLTDRESALMGQLDTHGYREEWVQSLAAARAELADERWKAGQTEAAVAYLSSSVELDPNHADRFELLADLLDEVPEPAAPFLAQSYYEQALLLNPSNRACRLKLAASYQATGELEDALDHYEALTLNAGAVPDPAFLQNLCLCYLSTNAEARGSNFLEKIVMAGAAPEFCLSWSILIDAQGNPAEAARLCHYTAEVAQDAAIRAYAEDLVRQFEQKGGAQ